jgi:hypothetical protein
MLTGNTSCFLSQQVVAALMFWSYIPIISFGIMVAAFAVKMPIEVRSSGF